MNPKPKPLSQVAPWSQVADGYADTTMKIFAPYIKDALALAGLSDACRVLDVACGPGTLALPAASLVASVDAVDFSQPMVDILNNTLTTEGITNVTPLCCDGQALPFSDDSFDAAFSMFGLMFFPDRGKGYGEIYRTLKPGGRALISSWAPVHDSPAMQTMFGAIQAMKPELPDPRYDVESLENPEFFKAEMGRAGFHSVEVRGIEHGFDVNSAEQFWQTMTKGSAPIVIMKNSMSADEWQTKEQTALTYLENRLDNLPTSLSSKAWLALGVK